ASAESPSHCCLPLLICTLFSFTEGNTIHLADYSHRPSCHANRVQSMLDYRCAAETCSGPGVNITASVFAVHTPATPLPITSKSAVLAREPVLSTSASASRDPHASPAPRLNAFA